MTPMRSNIPQRLCRTLGCGVVDCEGLRACLLQVVADPVERLGRGLARWAPSLPGRGCVILAGTSLPQDLTPHERRHTCAAPLIAKCADPKAIQLQMRHSSIRVTFDVYGHLFPGHLDDVMAQLDADHRAARPAAQ